jgi:DedD protein
MSEHLKKRLVGAIVLTALAVIFVPMLLEGNNVKESANAVSKAPEMPQPAYPIIEIPLQSVPMPAQTPRPLERPQEAPRTEPKDAKSPPTEIAAVNEDALLPAESETLSVQAVRPEDVKPEAAPVAASWAVQVGSFSAQKNALQLRDALRGKGFPAYIEQMQVNSAPTYRVRVGPMLTRADAEAAQEKMVGAGQRGIVVPHP